MTYGLVLMVKDEASVLDACLASVRPYISAWTVVDTGSTDDTPKRVETALEGIPGKLWRLPFRDFGHSRSELLVAAHGTADWLICLDADMTIEIDDDFEPDPAVDAYLLAMGDESFQYRLPLLLNGRRAWKSVGAVHEFTVLQDDSLGRRESTDKVRITDHGEGRSSSNKTRWHVSLLEADLEREPDNPRTVFYLAQSLRELGDPRALDLYRRRVGMGGYAEEVFYSRYRAGTLEPDWPMRQAALIEAWESRPARLEPLHALVSELNRRDMHASAYRLSVIPDDPPADLLFVHRDVWDWGMAFQRSIAAWWVGERAESRALSRTLLDNPRLPASVREAVIRNLALTPEVKAA